ncbi:hypothetical protein L323_01450 [Ruminiclostridium papyrosolvens C7]|uniref:Uncharacterized protein n=1 Tax=Ruminiclostridium papyrosolvens C7 TaxID=1330534 RepID=U4R5R3_9FIRM|nr:hypothetical protein L323_01450 [Ruminiclostridium papyrosolvens C7]
MIFKMSIQLLCDSINMEKIRENIPEIGLIPIVDKNPQKVQEINNKIT